MNHLIKFLDGDNKWKLVPASFSDFLELLLKKNQFQLKKSDRYNRYNISASQKTKKSKKAVEDSNIRI